MNKDDLQKLSSKIFTKAHFKKLGICLVLCGIIAGSGGYFAYQQKIAHKAEVNTARIALATAQAAEKNLTLLPESQVRSIAAQAINQDEMNITFREISLKSAHEYNDDRYDDDHDGHDKQDRHNNKKNNGGTDADTHATNPRRTNDKSAVTSNPVYKVKCYANNVKYKVYIDAINGNVLRCKVDD